MLLLLRNLLVSREPVYGVAEWASNFGPELFDLWSEDIEHLNDDRPDLKQLLYILTVSDDGGVPVYFQTASGNITDDQTHQDTWKLMAQLVQRPDFVYVADCKLATTDNMNEPRQARRAIHYGATGDSKRGQGIQGQAQAASRDSVLDRCSSDQQ